MGYDMTKQELDLLVDEATSAVIDMIPAGEYYEISDEEKDNITIYLREKILNGLIIFKD